MLLRIVSTTDTHWTSGATRDREGMQRSQVARGAAEREIEKAREMERKTNTAEVLDDRHPRKSNNGDPGGMLY